MFIEAINDASNDEKVFEELFFVDLLIRGRVGESFQRRSCREIVIRVDGRSAQTSRY